MKSGNFLLPVFLAILVAVSGCTSGTPQSKEEFAKCITDNGAVMYGAYWCSHCQNQKMLFGSAFEFVAYVECTEETPKCEQAGVRVYPTWVVNGQLLEGEQELSTLAKLTGCKY